MDEQQKKSKYDIGDENYPEPKVRPAFLKGLAKIGGYTPLGPRLNLVWGCNTRWFRLDQMRLKYLTGYAWTHSLHRDKKTKLFYTKEGIEELGLPRHIVEVWLPPSYFGSDGLDVSEAWDISASPDKDKMDRWEANWNLYRYEFFGAEAIALGLNQDFSKDSSMRETLTKVGAQLVDVLGPFPRNGEYRHFYTIQNEDGSYKEPTMDDLDFIRAAYVAGYETKIDLEQQKRDYLDSKMKAEQSLYEQFFNRSEIHKEAIRVSQKNPFLFLGGKEGKENVDIKIVSK